MGRRDRFPLEYFTSNPSVCSCPEETGETQRDGKRCSDGRELDNTHDDGKESLGGKEGLTKRMMGRRGFTYGHER